MPVWVTLAIIVAALILLAAIFGAVESRYSGRRRSGGFDLGDVFDGLGGGSD